jgi:hypothetical protein
LDHGQIVFMVSETSNNADTFFACFIQKYASASEGYSQPFHAGNRQVLAQGRLQIWPLITPNCNSSMSC